MSYISNISTEEYTSILKIAKRIDYNNFLDMAHDAILKAESFEDCRKKIHSQKSNYQSRSVRDNTIFYFTDKVCSKCNTVKPLGMFGKYRRLNVTDYHSACRECQNRANREWRAKNADYIQAKKKGNACIICKVIFNEHEILYYKGTRKKRLCSSCLIKRRTKLQRDLYQKRYSNPITKEKYQQKRKQYREENRDKIKLYKQKYNIENQEKIKEMQKKWNKTFREKNPERLKEKRKEYDLKYYHSKKIKV